MEGQGGVTPPPTGIKRGVGGVTYACAGVGCPKKDACARYFIHLLLPTGWLAAGNTAEAYAQYANLCEAKGAQFSFLHKEDVVWTI